MSERADLLAHAATLIDGDRDVTYGTPADNFARIAAIWDVIFGPLLKVDAHFGPHHVAMAMAAIKLARLVVTPDHRDSWADLAGYAAVGWEVARDG